MAGEIHLLSAEVQSRIRSGIALPSLTQCVEELVANALDAGASCVAVRVNLSTFRVQAVDNGCGITEDQLQLLGERYATSKCHTSADLDNLQYFGYRGEAIASIRDAAAVLEIISRAKGSQHTYCKMFHKGSALPVTEAAVARPSVGTTVTAHDLFYSLAVRRRGFNAGLEMERLCYRLQAMALMWPSVSLSLRNDETAQVLLQTKKSEDVLGVFSSLFGEAQSAHLRRVSLDSGHFCLRGYMGREGHSRKELQFLYINHRPVLNTKLHKAINSIFAKTSIFHRRSRNPLKHAAEAASSNSSPTKYGDKFPVFVLDVQCPLNEYDITFGPTKTLVEFRNWDPLLEAVEKMTTEFLRSEDLMMITDKDKGKNSPEEKKQISKPTRRKLREEMETKAVEEGLGEGEGSISEGGDSDWNDFADKLIMARGREYGEKINTADHPRGLFSLTVVRPKARNETDCPLTTADSHTSSKETSGDKDEVCDAETNPSIEVCNIMASMSAATAGTAAAAVTTGSVVGSTIADATTKELSSHAAIVPPAEVMSGSRESYTVLKKTKSSGGTFSVQCAEDVKDSSGTGQREVTCNLEFSNVQSLHPNNTTSATSEVSTDVSLPTNSDEESTAVQPLTLGSSRQNEAEHHALEGRVNTDAVLVDRQEHLIENHSAYPADNSKEKQPLGSHFTKVKDAARQHSENLHSRGESAEKSARDQQKIGEPEYGHFEDNDLGPGTSGNELCSMNEKTRITRVDARSGLGDLTDFPVQQPSVPSTLSLLRRRPAPDNVSPEEPGCDAISRKLRKLQQQKEKSAIISSSLQQFRSSIGTRGQGARAFQPDAGRVSRVEKSDHADAVTSDAGGATHSTSLAAFRRVDPAGLTRHPASCSHPDVGQVTSRSFLGNGDGNTQSKESGHSGAASGAATSSAHSHSNRTSNFTGLRSYTDVALESRPDADPRAHHGLQHDGGALEGRVCGTDTERRAGKRSSEVAIETGCCKHRKHAGTDEGCSCLGEQREVPVAMEVDGDAQTDEQRLESWERQTLTSDLLVQAVGNKEQDEVQLPATALTSEFFIHPLARTKADTVQGPQGSHAADLFVQTLRRQEGGEDKMDASISPPSGLHSSSPPRTPALRRFDMTEILIQTPSRFLRKKNRELKKPDPSDRSDCPISHNISKVTEPDNNCLVFKVPEVPVLKQTQALGSQRKATAATATTAEFLSSSSDVQLENDLPLKRCELPPVSSEPACMGEERATAMEMLDADLKCLPLMSTEPFLVSSACDEPALSEAISPDSAGVDGIHQSSASPCLHQEEVDQRTLAGDPPCTSSPEPAVSAAQGSSPPSSSVCQLLDPQPSPVAETVDAGGSQRPGRPVEDGSIEDVDKDKAEDVVPDVSVEMASDHEMHSNVSSAEGDQSSPCVDDQSAGVAAQWTKMVDPSSGQDVYVNLTTGHTSLSRQNVPPTVLASLHKRTADTEEEVRGSTSTTDGSTTSSSTVTALIEQHQAAADSVSCKWKDPEEAASCSNSDDSYIERLLSSWENPVFARPQETADESGKSAIPTAKTAQLPQQFNKNMLKNFKVVGQVDGKFLACLIEDDAAPRTLHSSPSVLVIIDQHAAHERIRLERDYVEVYEDKEKRIIKRSIVDPPHKLTLAEGDVRVLENFREEFHRIGIQFHRDLEDRRVIYLETLPACTVSIEPNPLRGNSREPLAVDIAETLIKEYVQTLRSSHGAVGRMPPTLHEVLCNHACRGAIKFGDKLSRTRCISLMAALSRCSLPFQCAHGRPSTVPLLHLAPPQLATPPQKEAPPRLWKLRKQMAATSSDLV